MPLSLKQLIYCTLRKDFKLMYLTMLRRYENQVLLFSSTEVYFLFEETKPSVWKVNCIDAIKCFIVFTSVT